jgi:MFS family permease
MDDIASNGVERQKKVSLETQKEVVEVPDGGYGWFVVLGCFMLNFSTWGANAGYSTYLAYYLQTDKFPGGDKLDYAAIGGLAFRTGLTFGPLIRLMVKYAGVRLTVSVGAMLQLLGTMLAAFSTKLWQIYLTQGVVVGLGLGLNFIPSVTVLAPWFRQKRSLAQSISVAGSGVGGVIFNLGVQAMIKPLSLKWALIIQAIICGACNTVCVVVVRPRDSHVKPVMNIWDFKMLLYPVYILYIFYLCMSLWGYMVLLYNLADFTLSLGYNSQQASIVACMVSVGNFFGRPAVGRLADRFGPVTVSICCQSLVSLLCFAMWILTKTFATAVAFALIQGSMMGTLWVVIASIGTRLVGLRKLDVALSMGWSFLGAFGAILLSSVSN